VTKPITVFCPDCEERNFDPDTATRVGEVILEDGRKAHIVDVGFRCRGCNHEWGFDVLKDDKTRD